MTDKSVKIDRKSYVDRLTIAALENFVGTYRSNWEFIGYESDEGPAHYERFTQRHEHYYPYHKEKDLIGSSINALNEDVDLSQTDVLVIVGQGPWNNCLNKEVQLVKSIVENNIARPKKIKFIEISEEFNTQARAGMENLNRELGTNIEVETYTGELEDVTRSDDWHSEDNTTVISTGSMISNFDNDTHSDFPEANIKEILLGFARAAGPNGNIILGYDGNMDEGTNRRAYSSVDLSHFFYNMLWEIHSNAHGLSLHYMNGEGEYKAITKEELFEGKIVTYEKTWDKGLMHHQLEFHVPFELHVDAENPQLRELVEKLGFQDKVNGGLSFDSGKRITAMTSRKLDDQKISRTAAKVGIKAIKAHKDGGTGLCLQSLQSSPDIYKYG